MKIWRFYRIDDSLRNLTNIRMVDKYPLYAITEEKKYAKIFLKSRKKESFLCVKSDMPENEAIDILNAHRGMVLNYHRLLTRGEKYYNTTEVKALITLDEFNIIDEITSEGSFLEELNFINPSIFSNSWLKFLSIFQYVDLFRLIEGDPVRGYDELPQFDFEFDELSIFIMTYSDVIDFDNFPDTLKYRDTDKY